MTFIGGNLLSHYNNILLTLLCDRTFTFNIFSPLSWIFLNEQLLFKSS